MNRRRWLIAALLLAEGVLCAAIVGLSWGTVNWLRQAGSSLRFFTRDTVSATASETQAYPVTGPASLVLDARGSNVTVQAGASDAIVVTADKQAWGPTEAEAQARLAALQVAAEHTGSRLGLSVTEAPRPVGVANSHRADTIHFTIQVPPDTAVTVRTNFGDLHLTGTRGAVVLESGAGALTVRQVEGSLELSTGFGAITVEDVAAEAVKAESRSGNLSLTGVQVEGGADLHSDFGGVAWTEGTAARLTAHTSSGHVTLTGLDVAGALTVSTSFGSVTLEGVTAASYDLETSSGDVIVDGAAGPLTAESGFGDLTVLNAVDLTASLSTRSGAISLSGSLGGGPHTLSSDFGSISLSLPADTAVRLDLSTDYGRIESDLPVTITGGLEAGRWQGTLNGGGPQVTVHTNSGDILLRAQPS